MIIRFRMKNLLKSVKTINKKENVLKQMIFANITIIVIINFINKNLPDLKNKKDYKIIR